MDETREKNPLPHTQTERIISRITRIWYAQNTCVCAWMISIFFFCLKVNLNNEKFNVIELSTDVFPPMLFYCWIIYTFWSHWIRHLKRLWIFEISLLRSLSVCWDSKSRGEGERRDGDGGDGEKEKARKAQFIFNLDGVLCVVASAMASEALKTFWKCQQTTQFSCYVMHYSLCASVSFSFSFRLF